MLHTIIIVYYTGNGIKRLFDGNCSVHSIIVYKKTHLYIVAITMKHLILLFLDLKYIGSDSEKK